MTTRLPKSALIRYGLSLAAVVAALLITFNSSVLTEWSPYALALVAVIVSTWYGGRIAGFSALAITAIAETSMIIPFHQDAFPGDREGYDLILYLAIGMIVLILTSSMRRKHVSLTESEERYRYLFGNSPLPMWLIDDTTLRFIAFNQTACDTYGYSESELLEKTILDIHPPEDIPEIVKLVKADQRDLRHFNVSRHRRKDGSLIDVEIYSKLVEVEGRPCRLVTAIDISDRRRAEAFARESEARTQTIVENLTEGLVVVDPRGKVVLINKAALDMHELSATESPTDLTLFKLKFELRTLDGIVVHDRDMPLTRLLRGDKFKGVDLKIRRIDSDWERVFSYGGTLIKNEDGQTEHAVVTIVDVTERAAAEKDRNVSEELYRATFEQAAVGIAHVSLDRKYLRVNQGFASMLGYTQEELLNLSFQEITHPDDIEGDLENVRQLLSGQNKTGVVEKRYIRKNGSIMFVRLTASLVRSENGEPRFFVTVVEDITERKETEIRFEELFNQHRSILSSADEGILGMDLNGIQTFVNPSASRMLGFAPEELIGFEGHRLWHHSLPDGSEYPKKDCNINASFSDGIVHRTSSEVFWRKDGTSFPVQYASTPIYELENIVGAVVTFSDITDRLEAESRVRDTEARLRSIINTAMDAIVTIDEDGSIVIFNNAAEKMFGVPADEALGKSVEQFIPPEFRKEHRSIVTNFEYQTSNDQQPGIQRSISGVRSNGEVFPIESSISKIESNGKTFYTAILRDVSARVEAQEAIRLSEEKYRALVENAHDVIYSHDLGGTITSVNQVGSAISGYTVEELLSMNIYELIAPEHRPLIPEMQKAKMSGQAVTSYEIDMIVKGGRRLTADVSTWLVYENGTPVGVQGIARDITERKLTLNELKISEDRYRTLVEGARDMIYTHDLNGNYTSINSYGAAVSGYTVDEVLQKNIADALTPESLERAGSYIQMHLNGETVPDHLVEIKKKSGETFFAEVRSWLTYVDGAPTGLEGIARDVTDRLQLEERLNQSQKLEAVGLLAGGVAHDFNNLLTVISGYSDLALLKMSEDDKNRRSLEEIKRASERAGDLTRQLLAFSRKQVLKPQVTNLNDVVENVAKMLKRIITENIDFNSDLALDLKKTLSDPGQIEQVLMNLVINARDAMPNGGHLLISTANVRLEANSPELIQTLEPGDYVKLTVTDTGTGMDEELQSRIFEPFFTTKDVGKGSGLGLATVHGIVKQSNGEIVVRSSLGVGTSFDIYFPIAEDQSNVSSGAINENVLFQGTEVILIVEDESSVRNLAKEVLSTAGYEILMADGGRSAIEVSNNYKGNIDLLLTDVVMPEMGGPLVENAIRERRPAIKTLYMSGYADDMLNENGVLIKSVNFVGKPFTPSALLKSVREALSD